MGVSNGSFAIEKHGDHQQNTVMGVKFRDKREKWVSERQAINAHSMVESGRNLHRRNNNQYNVIPK